QVFQDIASIDPGVDFAEALREGLATCAAVLIVIGPRWHDITDARGRRRLDLADDWVRHEVAESLKSREMRVFPVLVDNAAMPPWDELRGSIQALTRRQALEWTARHGARDVEELVRPLRRIPNLAAPSQAAAAEPEQRAASAPPRQAPTHRQSPSAAQP